MTARQPAWSSTQRRRFDSGASSRLALLCHSTEVRATRAALEWHRAVSASAAPGMHGAALMAPVTAIGEQHMSMFNKVTKTFQWGPHTVTLETGEIARQSGGAVVVNIEDTVVLATVVARQVAKPGQDFFPLTVDYIEKTYAAGKIPGSFFKREGRPSELETLTSRLIDRPIRPLFPEGFFNEVQVVIHVLSLNPEVAGRHRRADRRAAPRWRSPASRSTARSAPRASATSTASTC